MKFKLVPVTKIEKITSKEDNVYDFSVQNDHSYIANGFVAHNSICTTRIVTGFGVPMFTSVLECASAARRVGIQCVADGGVRASGDIVKAVVAGADAIMVGRLLAGTDEAPGESREHLDPTTGFRSMKKEYKGMSSASTRQRIGSTALAEGVDATVQTVGPVADRIRDLTAGLKSGMSYGGAHTLGEMRNVRWMRQTSHGKVEGTPHILKD